jgi:hypothetical protein
MGLVFADVNDDGFQDVVAGSLLYLNPRGDLDRLWERVQLPNDVDVHFAVRMNDLGRPGLIGIKDESIFWLEPQDSSARAWQATKVSTAPRGRVQGYLAAALEPGLKPQLVFTKGRHLLYLRIPDKNAGSWSLVTLSDDVEEAGIAVGDIDRNGTIDIAAVAGDGHHAVWFENSGDARPWKRHMIGTSALWLDRLALIDVNGDGRLDLVASEESREGYHKARLYWFEAPIDSKSGKWLRSTILTLRSINSMDTADMDGDGSPDLVIAEHTDLRNGEWASDNVTAILYNRERGMRWDFEKIEVDQHSSHLGGQTADVNNDGVKEIVSIGWAQYCCIHLWSKTPMARLQGLPKHKSSASRERL